MSVRERQLTRAFVELTDTLVGRFDVADLLHRLIDHCTELLAVDAAGLILSDERGGFTMLAGTTQRIRLLELFQVGIDEGPCLACFHSGHQVLVPDLAVAPERWPQFASRARSDGFDAVHALPMRLRDQTIGTLNLFTTRPGPLAPADLQVAQGLADIATIGILQERAVRQHGALTGQLQQALKSRIVVEQAKGVLAQASRLDIPDAFEHLRRYARSHNAKLSDVARQLVDGTLEAADILPAPSVRTLERARGRVGRSA